MSVASSNAFVVSLEPSNNSFWSFKKFSNLSDNKETYEDNVIAVVQEFFSEKNNILSICRNELNYKYYLGYEDFNHHRIYDLLNWDSEFEAIQSEILKLPSKPDSEDCVKNIIIINYFLSEFLRLVYFEFNKRIKYWPSCLLAINLI